MPGLAGKNVAEAGCSFIGSVSRIQGRWLYNSKFVLISLLSTHIGQVLSIQCLEWVNEHTHLFVLFLFRGSTWQLKTTLN